MRDMIVHFGGLHFSHMDIFRVKCVQLLLDACAETLETLRLYPVDEYGKKFLERRMEQTYVLEQFVTVRNFNLSRNKSLRTLETTADSIVPARATASYSLRTALSSIASPAPLDVVIVYREVDFGDTLHSVYCKGPRPPCFHHHRLKKNPSIWCEDPLDEFELFREMHRVRDFRLVLCADVFDCIVEPAIKALEHVVKKEKERGGLDYLFFEPLVISERRTPPTRCSDLHAGWWTLSIDASAL